MQQHLSAGEIAHRLNRSVDAIYQVQRHLRHRFGVTTNQEMVVRCRQWLTEANP